LVLADLLCNEMNVGLVEDYCWLNPISESILKTLKLDETQLGTLREEAWVIFEEAKELVATIE